VWNSVTGDADVAMIDSDLASDRGLVTAVLLSLFTDRRAESDDVPPSGDEGDRRGWWADQFATPEGDKIGSRLWLLDRSTRTNETVLRAKEYVREALAWMIEDSVVESIDVAVETTANALVIAVALQRPGRDAVSLRFAARWDHLQEDV
jgi:phage gp46-like protein